MRRLSHFSKNHAKQIAKDSKNKKARKGKRKGKTAGGKRKYCPTCGQKVSR